MIDPTLPVTELPRIGPAVAARLARLGIERVGDLPLHLPRTWIDLTQPQAVRSLRRGESAVLSATVQDPAVERTRRRGMTVLTAQLEDAAGDQLRAVWFNQPFLASRLVEGSQWIFWGTIDYDFSTRSLTLANPKFTTAATILAVYPETEGITSAQLRTWIAPTLTALGTDDYLPSALRDEHKLMARADALRAIHQPSSTTELTRARSRLALDELVALTYQLALRRDARRQGQAPPIPVPDDSLVQWVRTFPFTLTAAQRKAAWVILNDLAKPTPMARLLLGDVGSGKTVVGAIAVFSALAAGLRVAWLAPTQILAEQHVATLKRLFTTPKHQPVLVTGGSKPANLSSARFLVGTHALLNVDDPIRRELGLVIVDEQHRFGVKQRLALTELRPDGTRPHLLSMTATPIPRSLALTVFGDLDCSFLDERPVGRKPVITRVIQPADRTKAYDLVAAELGRGRQAYVVCPFIDVSLTGTQLPFEAESTAVTTRAEAIANDPRFSQARIGLLHGRMSSADKQRIMEQFARNEIQLLVATSLIEVGIDVPNATVLVVEGADHFGLAQLHQLRGRVGRGDKQSLCVAIADDWSAVSQRRLTAFARSTDGFELAALDLELRGPGDLLGELQAGLPPLKLANLADTLLVKQATLLVEALRQHPSWAARLAQWFGEGNGAGTLDR